MSGNSYNSRQSHHRSYNNDNHNNRRYNDRRYNNDGNYMNNNNDRRFKPYSSNHNNNNNSNNSSNNRRQRYGSYNNQNNTQMNNHSFHHELKVPSKIAGYIIGRGGMILKTIEQITKSKIHFDQQNGLEVEFRNVKLSSDTENNLKNIINIIKTIIDKSLIELNNNDNNVDQEKSALIIIGSIKSHIPNCNLTLNDLIPQIVNITLDIPSSKVGIIIGKGGETIHSIQQKSNARVNVQPDNKENPLSIRKVVINGTKNTVDKAKAIINELLNNGNNNDSYDVNSNNNINISNNNNFNYNGNSNYNNEDNKFKKVIAIPLDKIGLVIGRGGEGIKSISLQCKVRILIEQTPIDGKRDLTIIASSKEKIDKTLEAIDERLTIGGRGNSRVAIFRQNADSIANDLLNGVVDPLNKLWSLDLNKQFNNINNHIHGGFNKNNDKSNLKRLINVLNKV